MRHLLRDAAIELAWLYRDIGEDIRGGWPTDELGWTLVDISAPLDEATCPRFGTRLRLNLLRRRILSRLEERQALARANGRSWPLPSAIHFLIGPDGDAVARCGFELADGLPAITWCESSQRAFGISPSALR
ncbi:MAG: hypothetical protein HZC22_17685 [Rhodocyclales bacterium]|nr:hypothetical protein [Rhodocyclales bacterium]